MTRSAWFFAERTAPRGWVCYDGDCRMCVGLARRFRSLLEGRGFRLETLQADWVRAKVGTDMTENKLVAPDGRILGGADAVAEIARAYWWAWPFWLAYRVPVVRALVRALYRRVAANRHCFNGACALPRRGATWLDALPLFVLTAAASTTVALDRLPASAGMWAIAAALWAGLKWLTLRHAGGSGIRVLAYLFLWPGMDATRFFDRNAAVEKPTARELVMALARTLCGVALFATGARADLPDLARGWIAMTGIVMALHFGIFHLLSIAFRARGIAARPIMNAPLFSRSLADFWGARWNRAFSDVSRTFVFKPLLPRLGAAGATMTVFVLSGLVHELLISLPARAGWGLPFLYFVLQGFAALALSRPRAVVIPLIALPAFALFHPPFVHNVVLPMLEVMR